MTLTTLFLLRADIPSKPLILQANGGKLIIGILDDGGSSGGKSTQYGVSAVKKQLGDKFTEKVHHRVSGKLLLPQSIITPQITSKPPVIQPRPLYTLESIVTSKILLHQEFAVCSKLLFTESFATKSKLLYKEKAITKAIVSKHSMFELANTVSDLANVVRDMTSANALNEKQGRIEKLKQLKQILQEDLRIVPSIQVDLNNTIHQRGDLMRITANLSKQSGQIWMRIIDSKGMIVQKAGMVKSNATGFQILVGTRDLKAGKYIIQVSNHPNFSPLGVAEFQVKGTSPIQPFIPVIPFLLTPDSPTQRFEKVRFKTMMDSRVDAICKQFENKVFSIDAKNLPIPPLHFNCRCHLEGIDE